jgi:hypothetical protein
VNAPVLADRGYDARCLRQPLAERGIVRCIPPHAKRTVQHSYDHALYQQHRRIENMLARLKDWWPVHAHYDRCAHTFLSPIQLAASFI